VDAARFQLWLDDYVAAWTSYEPEAIGELFSEDAEYRYHPWDSPVKGRAAIVTAWLDDRDDPDSWTAEYRPWLVSGDRAVAVGVSRYVGDSPDAVDREYHNVFLCRFDSDGRCQDFIELYLRQGS
jgi:hypothetical protein